MNGCTVLGSEEGVETAPNFSSACTRYCSTQHTNEENCNCSCFQTLRLNINRLLASYYQALTFLHQYSSFRTETTITIF